MSESYNYLYKQMVKFRSQGKTLEAIGSIFGITKERVRQILHRPVEDVFGNQDPA